MPAVPPPTTFQLDVSFEEHKVRGVLSFVYQCSRSLEGEQLEYRKGKVDPRIQDLQAKPSLK